MYKPIIFITLIFTLFGCSDLTDPECELTELEVTGEECITDSTYNLSINFSYKNPKNDFFEVFGREDKPLGFFKLTDLPVTIENFQRSGKDYDFIKVCINDQPECCVVHEFLSPDCSSKECKINDLELSAGDCVTDTTYNLTINFSYINANNTFFEVFTRNNNYIGYFKLSDLPVTIPNFKKSGFEYDYVKVCINDNSECCKEMEIKSPDCKK